MSTYIVACSYTRHNSTVRYYSIAIHNEGTEEDNDVIKILDNYQPGNAVILIDTSEVTDFKFEPSLACVNMDTIFYKLDCNF